MTKFFITLYKGYQTHCEHVVADDLLKQLDLLVSSGWVIANIERV